MNELLNVEDKEEKILIHGKERVIKFDLRTWAILEKELGGIKNIDKLESNLDENPINTITHLIYIALKDHNKYDGEKIVGQFTEEETLEEKDFNDIEKLGKIVTDCIMKSMPPEDKKKVIQENN